MKNSDQSLPSRFYFFGSGEEAKNWQQFSGKLAGSAQPGYNEYNKNDQEILEDLKNGLDPKIDDSLLNELDGIYSSGIRTVFSVAQYPYDRHPELLKYLWEHKYHDTEYITKIDGVNLGIEDYHAPTQDQLKAISKNVLSKMSEGKNVLVHCGFGSGRTGTVLAAIYMAAKNEPNAERAKSYIRQNYYPHAIEKDEQMNQLQIFGQESIARTKSRKESKDEFPSSKDYSDLETLELQQSNLLPLDNLSTPATLNQPQLIIDNLDTKYIEAPKNQTSQSSVNKTSLYSSGVDSISRVFYGLQGLQAAYLLGKGIYDYISHKAGPIADPDEITRARRGLEIIANKSANIDFIKATSQKKCQKIEAKLAIKKMHLDILTNPKKLDKMEQRLEKEREQDIYGFNSEELNACAAEISELKKYSELTIEEREEKTEELNSTIKQLNDQHLYYSKCYRVADKIQSNIIDVELSLDDEIIRKLEIEKIHNKLYETNKLHDHLKELDKLGKEKLAQQQARKTIRELGKAFSENNDRTPSPTSIIRKSPKSSIMV